MRRDVVRHLQGAYAVGERRACHATGFHRSSQRYRSRRGPQTELRVRLRDLAASRVRYGYRRLHVQLRREGWPVHAKRVYRLYSEEGLTIRSKVPRRKRAWRYRLGRPGATAPSEIWAMDFVADQLFDGRPIRILAVLDAHTREAPSIVPRGSFRAFDVVQELDRLARGRGRPKTLKVDDVLYREAMGDVGQWAHLNGVEIDFSRSGKPTDNAHIEAFNSRLRAECLNASWSCRWPMHGSGCTAGDASTTRSGRMGHCGT